MSSDDFLRESVALPLLFRYDACGIYMHVVRFDNEGVKAYCLLV
jgi:hypothetical protein